MRFTFKILESLPDAHVIEIECPACHECWQLARSKDVNTKPSKYTLICPTCQAEGYIEI